jgi:hypothetical protein
MEERNMPSRLANAGQNQLNLLSSGLIKQFAAVPRSPVPDGHDNAFLAVTSYS